MKHNLSIYILILALAWCSQLSAQQLLDRVSYPLSPSEDRYRAASADISLSSASSLYANPVYAQWRGLQSDTTDQSRRAIVYAGLAGADGEGDFVPYEGSGSTDYRVGAYGEYATHQYGTLSGSIQYAQGKHRNIGWSAMRQPEHYFPYISTDSCGGDFKFDSYYAEGSYGFTLGRWLLGAKGSFFGEQAYRLTDPRALNNTTWLRFNAGAGRQWGDHLFLFDAGYGRNKQHMQLRYWRPGQQDRFFVCYGFGLYDTRQSAVSFGKSRMYYIDEYNARLQYLSPQANPLRVHASLAYAYDHMTTEESDIYDLYESRSHRLNPMLRLTYDTPHAWHFDLMASADVTLRKGYENIIEEYLIDKENNIYDFRTIDTRQYYSRNVSTAMVALQAVRQQGSVVLSLQGGVTADGFEEKYKSGGYRVKVQTLTPHVKLGADWQGTKDAVALCLLYARQGTVSHDYDVEMQNQQIPHLDFQHAFAPYAFRCADLNRVVASVTYQHQFTRMAVGLKASLYLADGHRNDDATYTGSIGFPSSAPTISATPDVHQERWGSLSAFVTF
ncbi:MAG: hypothetical protein K5764_03630 [Prevotella sp.]|nr:hypothetical protein [Prevotella sp.]